VNGNVYTPPASAPFYVLAQGSPTGTDCFNNPGGSNGTYGIDAGLPAGDDCTIAVDQQAFVTTAPGLQTGSLEVTAGSASASVYLDGWVNNTSILEASCTSGIPVDFLTQPVGTETSSASIVVVNNSRSNATGLLQVVLSDQVNFIITSDTCSGSSLPVKQANNCVVDVAFAPTAGSVAPATITITDTGINGYTAGSITVGVQGNP
jgi:hypothetical protein